MSRSHLKKVFSPDICVESPGQILDILAYAFGLILGLAFLSRRFWRKISTEYPNFRGASIRDQNRSYGFTGYPAKTAVCAICIIAVFFLHLAGCSDESGSGNAVLKTKAAATSRHKTIVAVGDSLTAGLGVAESAAYPALLQQRLAGDGYHFKVVNAGVSGETSSGTLSRINWVISSLKPDIIILETGANDGLRGIDPDVLRNNLDRIVSIIKAGHIKVLLCGMKMLPNLGPEYVKAFARIYPEIAQKYAIPLVPFFLDGVAGDPRLNQPDGLHPTAKGYRRIVDHIYPYVLDMIKK